MVGFPGLLLLLKQLFCHRFRDFLRSMGNGLAAGFRFSTRFITDLRALWAWGPAFVLLRDARRKSHFNRRLG